MGSASLLTLTNVLAAQAQQVAQAQMAQAQDRIDILADGASATYGSDAIAGVINIVLKRAFDGAITQFNFSSPDSGGVHYQASQLWGRTWDGGDITLTYEWTDESPVLGSAHSKYTGNYTPWGLDDRTPLGASLPGTLSTGAPAQSAALGLGTSSSFGTNCSNCFAIPKGNGTAFNPINGGLGPTAPFSASQLNLASFNVAGNSRTNGARNEFAPFHNGMAYEIAPQQRNSAVITVDQRLTRNISFYGSGFYANRRVEQLVAAGANQVTTDLLTVGVPTFHPHYPTGRAPTNLRVSYDTGLEIPIFLNAYELSHRYAFGLNIDLPGDWHGQVYDSRSYDTNRYYHLGVINKSAVSAALGWTIGAIAANGTAPGIATWTRPAAVPYLNLFSEPYNVWAGFVQVNVPVFGDANAIPLIRRLDLEASWRHDQYHGTLVGGTSNPKVGFTWELSEDLGATVRGSWGTSFRFANAGEYSEVASSAIADFGLPTSSTPINIQCGSGGTPTAGS